MHVFVTGANGWIGSAVVAELLRRGHSVTGLARSDAGAAAVHAAGAAVHRGSIDDPGCLSAPAAAADAVIHTAFNHDFSRFAENGAAEKRAIAALGEALAGSGRPLIVASGFGMIAPGRVITESDVPDRRVYDYPRDPESAAGAFAERGVRTAWVRLAATNHGDGDKGFVPRLIALARETGVSAYVGAGENRWPAVHRFDTARLFGLILENPNARGAYHAVAEEGIPLRTIAETIGRKLGLPVVGKSADEADAHFTWLRRFAQMDIPATSARTQAELDWHPSERGLIDDLEHGTYFT